jgi:proline dehydrogenase
LGLSRSILLAMSQSEWLRVHAPRYRFVRRTVDRFMPGERLEDAIAAAQTLEKQQVGTVFTALGENVADPAEAEKESLHYVEALDRTRQAGLATEVSVKLTHLGLDLDPELCYRNLKRIIDHESRGVVWVDMEQSAYVDSTLAIFNRARAESPRVGICVQAYLYRTAKDLEALVAMGAAVRLVKGAYKEAADVAFPKKADVDRNYFDLTKRLLADDARKNGVRAAIATHDVEMIRRTNEFAASRGIGKKDYEFQMLYGIQRAEQLRLAQEGYRSVVLVAYGTYWYPWFMRRMAERPANTWFALKNIISG